MIGVFQLFDPCQSAYRPHSPGVTPSEMPHVYRVPVRAPTCCSLLMDQNLVVRRVVDKKVKERKKPKFPGLCREPIKPQNWACTAHKGTGRPLEEVLKAWGRRGVSLGGFPRARELAVERERERVRKKDMGTQALVGMIKIRNQMYSNWYQGKQGISNGRKVRSQSISQERES